LMTPVKNRGCREAYKEAAAGTTEFPIGFFTIAPRLRLHGSVLVANRLCFIIGCPRKSVAFLFSATRTDHECGRGSLA
jgi:hypothetical protein